MRIVRILITVFLIWSYSAFAIAKPNWTKSWPDTDFSKRTIKLKEIKSGGPPRDGIPSIDDPHFQPVDSIFLPETEPVITVEIDGSARAYPVRILMWHEIVNDEFGGRPITVTFCPLCNAAVVFDRKVQDRVLEFGTSGMLRNSDMIMYDRQTESLWQQFTGEAVVGDMSGSELTILPSRLESFALFKRRYPAGDILVPNKLRARQYGANPYVGYDGLKKPFLYDGSYSGPVEALSRVVAVGSEAWSLDALRKRRKIQSGDLLLRWSEGQNSALDTAIIASGKDVGNVTVTRVGEDVVYHIPFAFAFKAFHPDGVIHIK